MQRVTTTSQKYCCTNVKRASNSATTGDDSTISIQQHSQVIVALSDTENDSCTSISKSIMAN